MSTPSNAPKFDDLIHAPARLRICASLAPVQWAEFAQLRAALAVADSVLSKHMKQLADAGYVEIERFSKAGRSHVRASLTLAGRSAYVGHVAALREMLENQG
ncbi:MarR family transcriptional regulator [Arthrobacter sp. 7749]|nr:MarR family transcriptional regulator [Arthrobacter sp. 7749]